MFNQLVCLIAVTDFVCVFMCGLDRKISLFCLGYVPPRLCLASPYPSPSLFVLEESFNRQNVFKNCLKKTCSTPMNEMFPHYCIVRCSDIGANPSSSRSTHIFNPAAERHISNCIGSATSR